MSFMVLSLILGEDEIAFSMAHSWWNAGQNIEMDRRALGSGLVRAVL